MKVTEETKLGNVMESGCSVGRRSRWTIVIMSTEKTYELMALELRPQGYKGVNHLKSCGKKGGGNRNSKCKGPEVRVCLVCWEAGRRSVGLEGHEGGGEVGEVAGVRWQEVVWITQRSRGSQ